MNDYMILHEKIMRLKENKNTIYSLTKLDERIFTKKENIIKCSCLLIDF